MLFFILESCHIHFGVFPCFLNFWSMKYKILQYVSKIIWILFSIYKHLEFQNFGYPRVVIYDRNSTECWYASGVAEEVHHLK